MRNPYVDLCLSVQAARRSFEAIRTPLAPAVGVGASLYTHQLANVHRVLTDVRVRHLLADEVGLGKTVQALMVLNALRVQRSDLQALVIVPDRLVPQWRDEIVTRAHTAPIGDDDEGEAEGGQYVRLAWEAQLRMTDVDGSPRFALSDIDPARFNVLIVDELHRLRADVQDRIVRVGAEFEHLLVLTATPAFQRVERHAQLFSLLEPTRAAIARWRVATSDQGVSEQLAVGDDLSSWPDWGAATVVDDLIDRDRAAAESSDADSLPDVAMANCAYRRVIRTRREDYSGVLPRRRHCPVVVEPLGAEEDRQSLMWRYFGNLDELSTRFDPVLLAKRVVLSPPSLEQRVDFLRRKGHERAGLLEKVKPLVHRGQGDSRADALVDLLADVWANDPSERVLVAAQDNLTVDYLFDLVRARLPMIGPLHERVPLDAARVRQGMMTEAVEDLGGFGNETNENLEAFQRGDAQVLFAPEAAQVGLNLQCARVLVLYSVPWRPEEVEQWIGRLDRIGNAAAFASDDVAKTIDVYTIAQRGLVDEKVVTVLRRFRVFERSVNLDGDHLDEIARLIEDAALRPEQISWRELEDASEAMAAEDDVQELESALRPHLPWTVGAATAERKRIEAMPPAPPALRDLPSHSALGPRAWDRALEGMLKLLARAGDYHIRPNEDPETGETFWSLWYRFGERGMYGRRDVQSRVVFSFGADPSHERSPRYAHTYITRRGDIASPPRRSVTMEFERVRAHRPLRFLSFGDPLHDELINGWTPRGGDLVALDVAFFDDHQIWEHGRPGEYLVRLTVLDPAATVFGGGGVEERAMESIVNTATHSGLERVAQLARPFSRALRCALEADVRWLRSVLTATMNISVSRREGGQWASFAPEAASALLNPMGHTRNGVPRASAWRAPPDLVAAANEELERQRRADVTAARSAWSHRFPDLERALEARILVVGEEGRDAVDLAREELRYAEEAVRVATDRGNRAQISRAENDRDATADIVSMTSAFWEQRVRWLQGCSEEARSVRPQEQLTALIRARRSR